MSTAEILDDEEPGVLTHPDGSVTLLDEETPPDLREFDVNLADHISPQKLSGIAQRLLDLIEQDEKSREKRDKQYQEGLRRSGLGEDAPGGAEFEGASRVVHPMLAEACVDFESSAIKELFPPNGPVKAKIIGANMSPDRQEKARRKERHMNWQLTEQVQEYRHELEQLLTQLPLGGSQYMRWWWNPSLGRPCPEAVFIDDVFLPYNAASFYAADRITHRQYLSEAERDRRMAAGVYRDITMLPTTDSEESLAQQANNKIEGKSKAEDSDEDQFVVYEVYTSLDFDGEDPLSGDAEAPYIITIDQESGEVLALYRNWDEEDPLRRKLDWMTEFPFIPWRGAYGIGLPHLIGSLSAAATGALRALLDSAHINNAATGLKIGASKTGGQTVTPAIGTISTLESPPTGGEADIRKVLMPMPFNPPSTVLFELLGWITNAAKGVVSTAEEKIADASNNMPVGTAQALIEQGAKVFSAIHSRLHAAQARSLAILHRLNRDYLDDEVTKFEAGELLASRSDYQGPVDIIPVSDPNIFSQTQRYAQNSALGQIANETPQYFDMRAVQRRRVETLQIPNIDEVMPPQPKPQPTDPVSENLMLASGMQVQAFPGQDQLGHLLIHLAFLETPLLGGNAVIGATLIPHMLEHLAQHVGLYYAEESFRAVGAQFQPGQMLPPQIDMEVTRKLGQATPQVLAKLNQALGQMPDVVTRALDKLKDYQEIQRQITPQPPDDPLARATVDASLAETARKARKDAADEHLEEEHIEVDRERVQLDRQKAIQAARAQEDQIITARRRTAATADTGEIMTPQGPQGPMPTDGSPTFSGAGHLRNSARR